MGAKATKQAPRNRTPGGGSLRIDRQFNLLGVGRLQVASGTTDPDEFERINALLTMLAEMGEKDLLLAIKKRSISLDDLRGAHKTKALPALRARVCATDSELDRPKAQLATAQSPAREAITISELPAMTAVATAAPRIDDNDANIDRANRALVKWFWKLNADGETWRNSRAAPRTLARYGQSFAALRIRLGLARLTHEELQMLATLPTPIWSALEQIQKRGVTVSAAKGFLDAGQLPPRNKKKKKKSGRPARSYSMENRRAVASPVDRALRKARIGRTALLNLGLLLPDQWRVLERCDERVPTRMMVMGVLRLPERTRQELNDLAGILHSESITNDVRRTDARHWMALRDAWNGSAADWNHFRRGFSALLTGALGPAGHSLRKGLIENMQLRKERSRVTDVIYETFEQIMANVPMHYRAAFRSILQTGLRREEFVRLEADDLNPSTRVLDVSGTKNDSSDDEIKIDGAFLPDLMEAIPCPISASGLYGVWKKARTAAGFPKVRIHDLRHCFAQWSLDANVPDSEVQHALRQKSSVVTAGYRRRKQSEGASAGLAVVISAKRDAAARVTVATTEDVAPRSRTSDAGSEAVNCSSIEN